MPHRCGIRTVKRTGRALRLSIFTVRPATRAIASRPLTTNSRVRCVRPSSDGRSTRMLQRLSPPAPAGSEGWSRCARSATLPARSSARCRPRSAAGSRTTLATSSDSSATWKGGAVNGARCRFAYWKSRSTRMEPSTENQPSVTDPDAASWYSTVRTPAESHTTAESAPHAIAAGDDPDRPGP